MQTHSSLSEWLAWQESLHLSAIDLGLDRIQVVAERLNLLKPDFPIITVAGTNGKGSAVAMLSSILNAAGYKVGAYTSPHILRYNERVALSGEPVADQWLCDAFSAIEAVRAEVSLTYFEFGTLAAMWIFQQQAVDVAVLEVGLGGRLDATNLWDADVAALTSIALDHADWLGTDREQIAYEKASIARAGRALVCGDPQPPQRVAGTAGAIGADLIQFGVDFKVAAQTDERFTVLCCNEAGEWSPLWGDLPRPALLGDVQLQNAALVLITLQQSQSKLPAIDQRAVVAGLQQVKLPGRLQRLQQQPDVWLDVAHNPEAAELLAKWLEKQPIVGKTWAIFSILADKDLQSVVKPLQASIDGWHIFPLDNPRAASLERISASLAACGVAEQTQHADIQQAWQQVSAFLEPHDRVVIFGSFLVVSSLLSNVFQTS